MCVCVCRDQDRCLSVNKKKEFPSLLGIAINQFPGLFLPLKIFCLLFTGKADCPFYALAEYLGDQLTLNLPDFKFHKIIKTSREWQVSFIEVYNSKEI